MNIVSISLEQDDLATLVAALELAAVEYREIAGRVPELRAQFIGQAEVCERLRKMIGTVHGY